MVLQTLLKKFPYMESDVCTRHQPSSRKFETNAKQGRGPTGHVESVPTTLFTLVFEYKKGGDKGTSGLVEV